jgi:hypothetical protein
VGHQSPSRGRGKSVRLTGRCACVLRRIYFVNPTDPELQCRIAGRCDSRRWNQSSPSVRRRCTRPEHRPTAGGGRRPAHPAGAAACRHPDGCPDGLAAPGACARLTASTGSAGSTTFGCPKRGLVGGRSPMPDRRAPHYVRSRRSLVSARHIRGEITSPRSCSRSSTRTHDGTLKNPRLSAAAGCGDLKKPLFPATREP